MSVNSEIFTQHISAQAMFTCCSLAGVDDKVPNSGAGAALADPAYKLQTCLDSTAFPQQIATNGLVFPETTLENYLKCDPKSLTTNKKIRFTHTRKYQQNQRVS